MLRKIQDADLKGKRVLMRVDFNVSLRNGDVREKFKIEAAKESIEYVLSQRGAKLALISHLGRPDGKIKKEFSLEQLKDDVEEIIGVKVIFVSDCIGSKVAKKLVDIKEGELLLLENVRFHKEEKENNKNFVEDLAENFDIFINEAFGVSHRDQASVTGVARILPSYAGLWIQREIKNLDKVKNYPDHPAVAVIGGAKIDTKLPLIKEFEKNYDKVLVGGRVANEAIDKKIKFSEKVILPFDFAEDRFDIGPESTEKFVEIIVDAETVIWNGPMGKFEEPPFDKATNSVIEAVVENDGFSLVGGGESIEVLEKRGVLDKISFVSTGGGAMLSYLSGEKMPGIEILEQK